MKLDDVASSSGGSAWQTAQQEERRCTGLEESVRVGAGTHNSPPVASREPPAPPKVNRPGPRSACHRCELRRPHCLRVKKKPRGQPWRCGGRALRLGRRRGVCGVNEG